MKESLIEQKVCHYAKKKEWLTYKFTSPGIKGVPDRIFLKNKIIFFIEFKNKTNKLSKIQSQLIMKLENNKFKVFIVRDIKNGKNIIDIMDKNINE